MSASVECPPVRESFCRGHSSRRWIRQTSPRAMNRGTNSAQPENACNREFFQSRGSILHAVDLLAVDLLAVDPASGWNASWKLTPLCTTGSSGSGLLPMEQASRGRS